MKGQNEVFENLKSAFEEAVQYVIRNDVQEIKETRRTELIEAVLNEVSRRNERTEDVYLKTILSKDDINRLNNAISLNKTIIVDGTQGPTGKTTLVNFLKKQGVKAVEPFDTETVKLNNPINLASDLGE